MKRGILLILIGLILFVAAGMAGMHDSLGWGVGRPSSGPSIIMLGFLVLGPLLAFVGAASVIIGLIRATRSTSSTQSGGEEGAG